MKFSVLSWSARPSRRFASALVVAALASGAALAAWADAGDAAAPHGPPRMAMGLMMPPHGPMLDHVLDDAKASAAQRAQVHQILDAADADLKTALPADRADHEQLSQLFTAPVVDAAAVEAVRERIEARRDAQSRRMMQAMIDVSAVLSADQRQTIAADMAAREHAFGGPRHPASAAQ